MPYADDTEILPAPKMAPRPLAYPEVPLIYPGRPNYCSGCCTYQAFLWKRDGEASTFKPRNALPGQANCESCAAREREATAARRAGVAK